MFRKTTEAVHRYQNHEVLINLNEFPNSMKKPNFKSSNETIDENGNVFNEISSSKSTVTDDRPVHIGGKKNVLSPVFQSLVAILMLSKLMLLEFVFFLYDHVQKGHYRNVYCDTGTTVIKVRI